MPAAKKSQSNLSELITLIFVMGRIMRSRMENNIKSGPLNSMLQFETLRYIKDNDRPYMRDVAKQFHITPPAATTLIETLAKDKLVTRVFDEKDRRSVKIELTDHGKKFFNKHLIDKEKSLSKMLSVLNSSEQKQFISILQKLTTNNA